MLINFKWGWRHGPPATRPFIISSPLQSKVNLNLEGMRIGGWPRQWRDPQQPAVPCTERRPVFGFFYFLFFSFFELTFWFWREHPKANSKQENKDIKKIELKSKIHLTSSRPSFLAYARNIKRHVPPFFFSLASAIRTLKAYLQPNPPAHSPAALYCTDRAISCAARDDQPPAINQRVRRDQAVVPYWMEYTVLPRQLYHSTRFSFRCYLWRNAVQQWCHERQPHFINFFSKWSSNILISNR